MLKRIIVWTREILGIKESRASLKDQLFILSADLLDAKIQIRKLKMENRHLTGENERLEDECGSAWEMLDEIKKAENFLAGNPGAIQDTLENIEDQMLVEMLQKGKTYGEA